MLCVTWDPCDTVPGEGSTGKGIQTWPKLSWISVGNDVLISIVTVLLIIATLYETEKTGHWSLCPSRERHLVFDKFNFIQKEFRKGYMLYDSNHMTF